MPPEPEKPDIEEQKSVSLPEIEIELKSDVQSNSDKTRSSGTSDSSGSLVPKYKVDHGYLIRFCLILSIASSIQAGWAMAENGQVGYILAEKLRWQPSDITKCTLLGPAGIAVGSMIASKIGPKFGIKKLLLAANGLAILSNLVKVIETSTTIYMGRIMFSICTGATSFCIGKAISETVPVKFGQRYGILVNSGIQFGVLLNQACGIFLPKLNSQDPDNKEALRNDKNWRVIWLLPVVFEIISLVLIPIFYKHLSLKKLIQNDRKFDLAKQELQKTYKLSTKDDAGSLILSIKSQSSANQGGVTLKDALFSKQYTRASLNAVVLAYLHQYSGNSTVMLFSNKIFLLMQQNGKLKIPIFVAVLSLMSFAAFISFFASVPQKYLGQRKALLTGQTILVLSLFSISIFNHLDQGYAVVFSMITLVCAFQLTLGPIYFLHSQETCVDVAIGFSNQNLYLAMLSSMTISSYIIDNYGNTLCFLFFAIVSLSGLIYSYFFVKDTTFGEQESTAGMFATD